MTRTKRNIRSKKKTIKKKLSSTATLGRKQKKSRKLKTKLHKKTLKNSKLRKGGTFFDIEPGQLDELQHIGLRNQAGQDTSCGACTLNQIGFPEDLVNAVSTAANRAGNVGFSYDDMTEKINILQNRQKRGEPPAKLYYWSNGGVEERPGPAFKNLDETMNCIKAIIETMPNGSSAVLGMTWVIRDLGHYVVIAKSISGTPYIIEAQNATPPPGKSEIQGAYRGFDNIRNHYFGRLDQVANFITWNNSKPYYDQSDQKWKLRRPDSQIKLHPISKRLADHMANYDRRLIHAEPTKVGRLMMRQASFTSPASAFGAPPPERPPAPSSAFGAPSSAFGAPSSAFGAPSSAFGAPPPEPPPASPFGAPSSAFGAPPPEPPPASPFGAPASPFGAPASPFGAPSSAFGAPPPEPPPASPFGAPSSAFGAPSSAFGAPPPEPPPASPFGAPSSAFGAPSSAFGAPPPERPPASPFGAPSSAFGAPSYPPASPFAPPPPPASAFGAPSSAFGAPSSAFGAPSVFGKSSPTFGKSSPAFGKFGKSSTAFGAPKPDMMEVDPKPSIFGQSFVRGGRTRKSKKNKKNGGTNSPQSQRGRNRTRRATASTTGVQTNRHLERLQRLVKAERDKQTRMSRRAREILLRDRARPTLPILERSPSLPNPFDHTPRRSRRSNPFDDTPRRSRGSNPRRITN